MTLFLRDKKNNTIVDVDCYVKTEEGKKFVEINSTVCIGPYSLLLLQAVAKGKSLGDPRHMPQFVETFNELQELRGWLWESYFMGGKNDPEKYNDVLENVRKILKAVAMKYDLGYVED